MSLEGILADLGYGGFAGFVVGFAVRRVLNIFLMLMGLYILSLLWLKSKGIIDIHWSAFFGLFKGMFESFGTFVQELVRKLAFSGAFMTGFMLGYRM
ncbi:MAG: hypothetical protein NZ527_04130 [Hydrogenobacter thermophilus]|nr:hypothetical protein [Hydrogenobacter thermophilus]